MLAIFRLTLSWFLFVAIVSTSHVVLGFTTAAMPKKKMTTPLFMSSVPSGSTRRTSWKDVLPPSPEDQLVMTGDVAALFVYSFLDHSLNGMYVDSVQAGVESGAAAQALDPLGELSANQVPVWFDSLHSTISPDRLFQILGLQDVAYSPILATAGTASVAITACWLLSGWINQAFSYSNTVDCTQSRALEVTGKAWLGACILMVALALASDYVWGNMDSLHSPSLGGLTKADADFIFDSLSVLVTWRFVVSWLLGSGGKKK